MNPETPDDALLLTTPGITAHARKTSAPIGFSHGLRRPPQSLSLDRSTMRLATIVLVGFSALISLGASGVGGDILPKGWLSPEQLQRAENPIQQQLDTGRGMGGTAWDMAAVK